MESLNDWIQRSGAEVLIDSKEISAPHVVGFVLRLLKTQPNFFVYRDLSDWPQPRKSWNTFGQTMTGKKLTVSISSEIRSNHIEILVRDGDLRPGAPTHDGEFGYRVDILAGEATESYKKTVGFVTSSPSFVFDNLDTEVIISDNWSETITGAEEIMRLLSNATFSTSRQITKS